MHQIANLLNVHFGRKGLILAISEEFKNITFEFKYLFSRKITKLFSIKYFGWIILYLINKLKEILGFNMVLETRYKNTISINYRRNK